MGETPSGTKRGLSGGSTPSPVNKRHIAMDSPELLSTVEENPNIAQLLKDLKQGQDSLKSLVNSKVDSLRNEILLGTLMGK